jgi:hypothetical protein
MSGVSEGSAQEHIAIIFPFAFAFLTISNGHIRCIIKSRFGFTIKCMIRAATCHGNYYYMVQIWISAGPHTMPQGHIPSLPVPVFLSHVIWMDLLGLAAIIDYLMID